MPRLHLISEDIALAEQILPMLDESGFRVAQSAEMAADLTTPPQGDVVIFAPYQFDEEQYRLYLEHPLHEDAEWMLVSNGVPNPWLDKMMSQGVAYHFRTPIDDKHFKEVIGDFYVEIREEKASHAEAPLTSNLDQFGLLLGSSAAMRRLYRLIRRVSQTDANVLLIGESGSGKELAARTIHQQSPRANKPFIAINCAALTAELVESELFGHKKGAFTGAVADHVGFFEQGGDGTLFLDEITEMPLALQSKLLRVLETGEFTRLGSDKVMLTQVRVVAATNRIPSEAIEEGYLREDLYFRLAHFPIQLPPLRKRGSDVIELAKHFLAYRNKATETSKAFTDEALDAIGKFDWPGNVRELKHCVERAHILAIDDITLAELPSLTERQKIDPNLIRPGISLKEAEKALILATLDACEQNKTLAAEQLGISVKTLYNKLERYEAEEAGSGQGAAGQDEE
ncbi:sigma-54 interaction domain-containing protein [Marinobacterium mangrovicola]|nr:sigma-54 dependent transcriptional regulator [Marinobacterium mangrovicola]